MNALSRRMHIYCTKQGALLHAVASKWHLLLPPHISCICIHKYALSTNTHTHTCIFRNKRWQTDGTLNKHPFACYCQTNKIETLCFLCTRSKETEKKILHLDRNAEVTARWRKCSFLLFSFIQENSKEIKRKQMSNLKSQNTRRAERNNAQIADSNER